MYGCRCVCVCGGGGGSGVSAHINKSLTTITSLYVRA